MKKIILSTLVLSLLGHSAFAEEKSEEIKCYQAEPFMQVLKRDFGEEVWSVQTLTWPASTITVMTVNEETGTWTIFSLRKKTACVLMAGNNFMRNE